MASDERAEVRAVTLAGRLEAAAAWLREHPEEFADDISVGEDSVRLSNYEISSAAEIAERVKRLGGRWDKDASSELFYTSCEVVPGVVYRLVAWRKDVCERVVVAQRQVQVEEPDPAAVAALPRVRQMRVEEVVEWRCAPLLGLAPAAITDEPAGSFPVSDGVPF